MNQQFAEFMGILIGFLLIIPHVMVRAFRVIDDYAESRDRRQRPDDGKGSLEEFQDF